jgi:hypothetical protein
MMTRKDYVIVAQILSSYKDLIGDEFTYHDLVDEFAGYFAEDNPNFKPDVFITACNRDEFSPSLN